MSSGACGGRSPPRPHLFGGLNFPVVSEEGNTSILRSNADQEQEDEHTYEGAKEMLLVDDVDNKEFLRELLGAMDEELPTPKKKK